MSLVMISETTITLSIKMTLVQIINLEFGRQMHGPMAARGFEEEIEEVQNC
jgi:hypothetical protein